MNLLDRPRRLRATPVLREMTAETQVSADHLITPHFVVPGQGIHEEIPSMPGIFHVSVDRLLPEIEADLELGLRSHLLFGVPEHKNEHGDYNEYYVITAHSLRRRLIVFWILIIMRI